MTSDSLTVRKRRAWSSVPDDILTDARMSERARLLLAWMIGRRDGWEIRVSHVQSLFRLSETQWRAARRELEAAGYYRQARGRHPDGKVKWIREVLDMPISRHPPKKGGMVKPLDGLPPDGLPAGDQRGDIAVNRNKHLKEAVVADAAAPVLALQPAKHPRLMHGVRVWTTEDVARITAMAETSGIRVIEELAKQLTATTGELPLPSMIESALAERSRDEARKAKLEKQQHAVAAEVRPVSKNPERLDAARRAAGMPPLKRDGPRPA